MPLFGAPQGIAAGLATLGQVNRMRLVSAQAGLAQQALKEKQAEAQALQQFAAQQATGAETGQTASAPGAASAAPQQIGARLASEGMFLLKSGAPTAGMAMLKQADSFQTRAMQRAKYSTDIQKNQLSIEKGKADWLSRQISTFDPQAADAPQRWRQINLEYEQQFGEASPYTNVPYSPQLVQRIGAATMSYKDHLDEQMKELNFQEKQAHDAAMEQSSSIRAAASQARAATAKRREARLAKVGGKPAMAADKGMVDEARRLISNTSGVDNPETAAYNIASEAAVIAQHNPALSRSEAVHRAFVEAKQRGEFVEKPGLTIFGHQLGPSTRSFASGDSAATAIPVPDKGALAGKKNVWISTPRGVFWWTGNEALEQPPAGGK